MISIVLRNLGLDDNLIKTFFNSPITLTLYLSKWMIWISNSSGLTLIFSQTLRGVTFEEALESTMQLWTFMLKISKVNKKWGVLDFDLWPVNRDAFTIDCLFGVVFSVVWPTLLFPFIAPTLASLMFLEVVPYRVLMKLSWIWGSFISSNKEIFSFVIFKYFKNS